MRILVYGAGSMGLYFSARLAQAGHNIILKSRSSTSDSRIQLNSSRHQERDAEVQLVSELKGLLEMDAVLIATKAWQVEEALEDLQGMIDDRTALVTLQNGLDAPEVARQLFPGCPVIATTCVVIVKRTAPLALELIGGEVSVSVGCFDEVGAVAGVPVGVTRPFRNSLDGP